MLFKNNDKKKKRKKRKEINLFNTLKAHSQIWDKAIETCQSDEKCFLFNLKSSFRSQDI